MCSPSSSEPTLVSHLFPSDVGYWEGGFRPKARPNAAAKTRDKRWTSEAAEAGVVAARLIAWRGWISRALPRSGDADLRGCNGNHLYDSLNHCVEVGNASQWICSTCFLVWMSCASSANAFKRGGCSFLVSVALMNFWCWIHHNRCQCLNWVLWCRLSGWNQHGNRSRCVCRVRQKIALNYSWKKLWYSKI